MRIDTLRLSITRACNLRCAYCRAAPAGRRAWAEHSRLALPFAVSLCAFLRDRFGMKLVRLTGGEPLLRADVLDWVRELSALGIETAMTTNGLGMARLAQQLKEAGLSRVNLSLDSLDERTFRRMCGAELADVLRGIECARAAGFAPIRTNTVVLRGWNDGELPRNARYAFERGIEPRFLELMDIGVARENHSQWFVSAGEITERLSRHFELRPLGRMQGETANRFVAAKGGRRVGVLGVISPESAPFCTDCRRLRLSADGHLFGCFMHDGGIDLSPCWDAAAGLDAARLEQLVLEALSGKDGICARRRRRAVVEIGG